MRRRVVAAAAVAAAFAPAAAAPTPAAPPPALWRQLSRTLTVPQVSRRQTAAIAVDLASGRILFQHNQTRPLAPASNEKLAVTYTALATFGPGYRVRTQVLGSGVLDRTTWRGNLLLKGYGDPTLTRPRLRSLSRRVKALGIRHVTGRVLADESFFDRRRTAPGWKPSFYLSECPALSALVVDRGVTGSVLTRAPALTAAGAFTRMLRAAGVSVAGKAALGVAPEGATQLATTLSPPLWKVVRFMDRESDNFTAEMLLKQLGGFFGSGGSTPAGAAVVTRTLAAAGVPLAGVRIVDGSGLSLLDPRGGVGGARDPARLRRSPRGRRSVRNPPRTHDTPADQGERDREDGHDDALVGALRLREPAIRVLGGQQWLSDRQLVGSAGAGPLRDAASAYQVALRAPARRAPARRATRLWRASSRGSPPR